MITRKSDMLNLFVKIHDYIYKDMVYSVSRDCWFYKEGTNGEYVD